MLKKSASTHKPSRGKRETYEKGAIRSSKFKVRSSEDLEPSSVWLGYPRESSPIVPHV
jgi:hypothetical protein